MGTPRIVQHSFGTLGSGGPIGALTRILSSDMKDQFKFLQVSQSVPARGINIRLILAMARQMRGFRPDLAHVRGLGNEGFHGVVAARLAGVPRILVSVHGSVQDLVHGSTGLRVRIVGRVLEPLTLKMATHVITVCEDALSKPVVRSIESKVVGVVPNGVDLVRVPQAQRASVRAEFQIGSKDIVLIVVARLAVDKGHLDLFRALEIIPEGTANIHLLVVGDGPDRQLIADRARSVNRAIVHLIGRRHDVPQLLAASDIALLPSWHENMSNALLEAMSAGLPVIATKVGGNTEVVSRGGGILVPAQDPTALAAAIHDLIHDARKRTDLGLAARAVVESSYSVRHMVLRLSQVYRSILES